MRTKDATRRVLLAEDFFAGDWEGRGEVSSLFGRSLRAFAVSYQGAWSTTDSAFICEEHVVYDDGNIMDRSWHLSRDRKGALLGLEAAQGGRMKVRSTRRGLRIIYDRPRILPGTNVTRLSVDAWSTADGRLHIRGWTRVLGMIPLFRTAVVLTARTPAGGEDRLRPANW